MTGAVSLPAPDERVAPGAGLGFGNRPPGERYYRHPGDVVRLVSWFVVAVLLVTFIEVATESSDGVRADFDRVASRLALSLRQLLLALVQVGAVTVPVALVAVLVATRRWRRLALLLGAATAGAAVLTLLDALLSLSGRLAGAVDSGTWIASADFPSLAYVTAVTAAATVGKPWLSRPWRRATDVAVATLVIVIVIAGGAGVPELFLALAAGAATGSLVLVVFGAPNRRPTPDAVAAALREAGVPVSTLVLERAVGGRSQLYRAHSADSELYLKVYGRDSRDADLLFRAVRAATLRDSDGESPVSFSLKRDVEHEAFLLDRARRGGTRAPDVRAVTTVSDGSVTLAMQRVDGRRLDTLPADELDDALLDATWREVASLQRSRIAHRALRAANVLVGADGPVIIDFGFAEESASPRLQALDRAELLTSLAVLAGPDASAASAVRVLGAEAVAAAVPYIQPLALSSATRKQSSKKLLAELRERITSTTGIEAPPLEQLVRVKPRTLLMITAAVGAFYVLLPQLANVDDSFRALRSANWAWLLVAIVLSGATYVASAIGNAGGVPEPVPLVPNVEAQVASSFVNRVAPANVAGMALNVRFLRKIGVEPAEAVTGVGLNSAVGAIVHVALLVMFFSWAGQDTSTTFKIPAGSKTLAVIAAVFAVAGVVAATRRGRRLIRVHVFGFIKASWASLRVLARSPAKIAALVGGSVGVTLAYIGSLAACVAAFHGDITIAEVGAVYLGAALIAAAAPTPGGLGALEAALVTGLTGIGMDSGVAVAAVLSYRLATYWLPILPGWLAFRDLERRGFV